MPDPAQLPAPCERFHAVASLRLDAELPLLEAAVQAAHARRCADCRAHAAEIAAITARIRSAPAQKPSQPFFSLRRRRRRAARALAAAVLAVAIASSLGSSRLGQADGFAAPGAAAGSASKVV